MAIDRFFICMTLKFKYISMKNNNTHLLVTTIFLFFIACTFNKEKINFEKEERISSVPLGDSPFLGQPIALEHFNNQLIISDFRTDSLLTIFDLNINQVISTLSRKGIGPNEALPPLMISIVNDTLLTFNRGKFQIGYYLLKEKYNTREENIFLFKVPTEVYRIVYLRNNIFLSAGFFKNRYALLNINGDIDRTFGDFPEFLSGEKDRPTDAKVMFHQILNFTTNRNRKKAACLSSHILDIIDFSDNVFIHQRVQLDTYDYKFSTGNIVRADRTINTSRGALDITSTEKYIYVLFNYSKDDRSSEINTSIWVFDWFGSPIKKLILDSNTRFITAINDNVIYALALIEDEYNIVKLNIP